MINPFSLLLGWVFDLVFGDPQRLPHPVVWFGRMIAFGEHRLNRGAHRQLKGALMAIFLIAFVFVLTWWLHSLSIADGWFSLCFDTIVIFFCLAGTTLIREVRDVFTALDRSLEEGRAQVARIVGRDTSELSAQEVRTAALETLAENLSDGVIAPLFWLAVLGVPGMAAYKDRLSHGALSCLRLLGCPYRRCGEFPACSSDGPADGHRLPATFCLVVCHALWPSSCLSE